jgi:hypothetical protein
VGDAEFAEVVGAGADAAGAFRAAFGHAEVGAGEAGAGGGVDGEIADVQFVDDGIDGSPKGGLASRDQPGGIGVAQVEDHGAFAVGAGGGGVGIDGLDGGGLAGMDEAVAVVAVAQVAFDGGGPGAFGAGGPWGRRGVFRAGGRTGRGAGRRTARWGPRRGTRRRRGNGGRRGLGRHSGTAWRSPWNRRFGIFGLVFMGCFQDGLIFRHTTGGKSRIRENFFDGVPVEADLIHPCRKGMGVFRRPPRACPVGTEVDTGGGASSQRDSPCAGWQGGGRGRVEAILNRKD